ncbi:MAG: hypothetical protein KKG47_05890 [Proteobacteria bacterium]|nr:hypothetical protein [Pseudomonadota bacterium]MBU1737004.1 hypothetical protein [Pseudomonadota bacterium]
MRLNSEPECLQAIDEWKKYSPEAQMRNLNQAIEALELDQMYYEGKGSEKPAERCGKCLEILHRRLSELNSG